MYLVERLGLGSLRNLSASMTANELDYWVALRLVEIDEDKQRALNEKTVNDYEANRARWK